MQAAEFCSPLPSAIYLGIWFTLNKSSLFPQKDFLEKTVIFICNCLSIRDSFGVTYGHMDPLVPQL